MLTRQTVRFAVLTAMILSLGLAACGKKDKKKSEEKPDPMAAPMGAVMAAAKAAPMAGKAAPKAAKAAMAAKADPKAGAKSLHDKFLGAWKVDGPASIAANADMAKAPAADKAKMVAAFAKILITNTKDKTTMKTVGEPAEVDSYVVKSKAGKVLTIVSTDAKGKKETTQMTFTDDNTILGTEITPKGPGMKMILKRAK